MTSKLLNLLLICLGASTCLFGQHKNQYTPSELAAFVEIYFEQKDFKKENKMQTIDRYKKEDTKPHILFGTYFTKVLLGEDINAQHLSILRFLESTKVQLFEREMQLAQDDRLEQQCDTHHLKINTYKSILKQYRSNLDFQKEIRPYFLAYFNNIHE